MLATQHARFLFARNPQAFSLSADNNSPSTSTAKPITSLLRAISATLEKLHEIFYIDSLLLVVSPSDTSSDGWLGGSMTGREFWRGLRGGGVSGAKAFKAKSKVAYDSLQSNESSGDGPPAVIIPATAQGIKTELNRVVRQSLRFILINFSDFLGL